jgi:hypothetical protein
MQNCVSDGAFAGAIIAIAVLALCCLALHRRITVLEYRWGLRGRRS